MDISSPQLQVLKKEKEAIWVQITHTLPASHKAEFPANPDETCVYDPELDVLTLVIDVTETSKATKSTAVQWDWKIPSTLIHTPNTQLIIEMRKPGNPKGSSKGILRLKKAKRD